MTGTAARHEDSALRDKGAARAPSDSPRRICLRPDQVSVWKTVSVSRLVQEQRMVQQCLKGTQALGLLRNVRLGSFGVQGVDVSLLRRVGEQTLGPALAGLLSQCDAEVKRAQAGQAGRQNLEPSRQALENFHRSVQKLYSADIAGVDPRTLSRFHAGIFQDAARSRTETVSDLEDHLKKQLAQKL